MTTLAALKLQRCGFGASRGRWAGDARIKAGTAAYALKDALKDIRPEVSGTFRDAYKMRF